MLADAVVHALSLPAVGRSALAGWVLVDVAGRWLHRSEPVSSGMITIGAVALRADLLCLALVSRHRGGVPMRASLIVATNDTLANAGVFLAESLLAWTSSRLPDLLIGAAISLLVLPGGLRILREAQTASG